MSIAYELLKKQDDVTSGAVLALLKSDAGFHKLSESEGNDIITRDTADDTSLALGIQIAVKKGILPAHPDVSEVNKISVVGKSADAVSKELIGHLGNVGEGEGKVIVLQGLSGTGKGTTVAKLQQVLPKCVCWSNGNVFRSLTYLASKQIDGAKEEFTVEALTADLMASLVARLSFEKFGDAFDVVIDGTLRVSTIANTDLKAPHISKRVPMVASQTQGEVVKFAAGAVKTLREAGCNVILEGRAQTLNHIPTPTRFELVIEDTSILGQRRAAQRVMAKALASLEGEAHDAAAVDAAVIAAAAVL